MSIPKRMESLDQGASIRMGKRLERDCNSFLENLKQNGGLYYISSQSPFGFVLFELLLILPFKQNNPISDNVYITLIRFTLCYVLYKLIDDIYRPRLVQSDISRSGPIILPIIQFPLYTYSIIMIPGSAILVILFIIICKITRDKRREHDSNEKMPNVMEPFSDTNV